MKNYYYLDSDNNRVGPISREELDRLGLPGSTYVWYEGLRSWVRLSTLTTSEEKSSKGFFKNLTTSRIILLVYAALGSLLMLAVGRFLMAFAVYSAKPDFLEYSVFLFILVTLAYIPFLLIKKRRYWIHGLLILSPFWIWIFSSFVYYECLCNVYDYTGRYCEIKKPFGGYGVINEWGIECVPCIYDEVYLGDNVRKYSFCTVSKGGKKGICDMDGNVIVPCEWSDIAWDDARQIWYVWLGKNWGLLNADTSVLLPCEYSMIYNWSSESNLLEVQKDGYFGLLKPDGTWVLHCAYIRTSFNDEGFAKLNEGGYTDSENTIRGGRWGVINRDGRMIVPAIYNRINFYSDEIRGYIGNITYCYNYDGKVVNVY